MFLNDVYAANSKENLVSVAKHITMIST